jgi:hypothetical protein
LYLGIWLHESGALGASPDGIVKQHPALPHVHYQTGAARELLPDIVEVKCPYTGKDKSVVEAVCGAKGFLGEASYLL